MGRSHPTLPQYGIIWDIMGNIGRQWVHTVFSWEKANVLNRLSMNLKDGT